MKERGRKEKKGEGNKREVRDVIQEVKHIFICMKI